MLATRKPTLLTSNVGSPTPALVADFNGAGLADLGVHVPNGTQDARWVVKFNQGKGAFRDGARYEIDRRDIGGQGKEALVGDFTGHRAFAVQVRKFLMATCQTSESGNSRWDAGLSMENVPVKSLTGAGGETGAPFNLNRFD